MSFATDERARLFWERAETDLVEQLAAASERVFDAKLTPEADASMRVLSLQGNLVDSFDPALKEHRTVCFLAFDGHCYMYRAVKRVLSGRRRACSTGRGKADPAAHPRVEARRRGRAAGLVLVRGPAGGAAPAYSRRREPKVAISSPAQHCGLRLRRHQDPRLLEEHEVLRRWCEALRLEQLQKNLVRQAGQALAPVLLVEREVPGGGEAKTLAAQDGKCALCGCGLTGACELDHVVPVRQAFAGSVQTLQALCGDCHSEKTLRESAQPSRRHGVRPEPQAASSGFEAQTCAKDSTYVGVDVVRCRRNGLANAPFPLPVGGRFPGHRVEI